MKSGMYVMAVASLLLFASCKKDEKAAEVEKVPVKENFNIELDVIAQTQDDFTVYYTEDNTNAFVGAQAVWKGVNGGGTAEKVIIDLPESVIPTNLRFDFGIKPDRKEVVLQKIKISFYDKSFEIRGSEFLNYFIKNDVVLTEVNEANGTITFRKAPTSTEGSYFGPRQELLDKIASITK